jgi:hypothetical protein
VQRLDEIEEHRGGITVRALRSPRSKLGQHECRRKVRDGFESTKRLGSRVKDSGPEVTAPNAPGVARLELPHLLSNLSDRLLLELTDALARQIVLVADLLQRELVFVVEAEAPTDDPRFDGREGAEQTLYL